MAERRPDDAPRPWHARVRSFDLHAAVAVPSGARERLEGMCRYALRPAVGQERLRLSPEGQVVLDLRSAASGVPPQECIAVDVALDYTASGATAAKSAPVICPTV